MLEKYKISMFVYLITLIMYFSAIGVYFNSNKLTSDNQLFINTEVVACVINIISLGYIISNSQTKPNKEFKIAAGFSAILFVSIFISMGVLHVKYTSPLPNPQLTNVNWSGNTFTNNERCGPNFGNTACTSTEGAQCCNSEGVCEGNVGDGSASCTTGNIAYSPPSGPPGTFAPSVTNTSFIANEFDAFPPPGTLFNTNITSYGLTQEGLNTFVVAIVFILLPILLLIWLFLTRLRI